MVNLTGSIFDRVGPTLHFDDYVSRSATMLANVSDHAQEESPKCEDAWNHVLASPMEQ